MHAVLLAAGRGRRLGDRVRPKCLLKIAGRSLLERHLDNLAAAGVRAVTIVTGFQAERIASAVEAIGARPDHPAELAIDLVHNERYEHGSLVSLQVAADRLSAGGLWMDADVLYPAKLLARLTGSAHGDCVLLDARSSEQGEEMMLAVKNDRVMRIARRVGVDWDLVGESVGFFKVSAAGAAALKRILDAEVGAGRLDQEHEAALDRLLAEHAFGCERVDDLPWTEIDFAEDVDKALALAESIDNA